MVGGQVGSESRRASARRVPERKDLSAFTVVDDAKVHVVANPLRNAWRSPGMMRAGRSTHTSEPDLGWGSGDRAIKLARRVDRADRLP